MPPAQEAAAWQCAAPRCIQGTATVRVPALRICFSVIPGRAFWREPGIHSTTCSVEKWIPGSTLARRPGMTRHRDSSLKIRGNALMALPDVRALASRHGTSMEQGSTTTGVRGAERTPDLTAGVVSRSLQRQKRDRGRRESNSPRGRCRAFERGDIVVVAKPQDLAVQFHVAALKRLRR